MLQKRVDNSSLVPMLVTETALAILTAGLLVADLLQGIGNYWMLSFGLYAFLFLSVRSRSKECSTMPSPYTGNWSVSAPSSVI